MIEVTCKKYLSRTKATVILSLTIISFFIYSVLFNQVLLGITLSVIYPWGLLVTANCILTLYFLRAARRRVDNETSSHSDTSLIDKPKA
jgi:hypothetical protein